MSTWIIVLIICIVIIAGIVAAFTLTPLPASKLLRALFSKARTSPHPDNDKMNELINIFNDVEYPSKNSRNFVDVYMPKRTLFDKVPVIVWAHGGAYVGGDKKDVHYYATALASEGYVVVSMNYELAPEAKYPTPIRQTAEVFEWLATVADEYHIDMDKIVLAGDSAGAHMMSQFALLQGSPEYSSLCQIDPVLDPKVIKGILLYCGPYDATKLGAIAGPIGALLNRSAWAYYGCKNWVEEFGGRISIVYLIENYFPPAFITDSNKMSFLAHAKELEAVLQEKGLVCATYFMTEEEEKTMHEYQSRMGTPAGLECYKRTVEFLKKLFY